MDDVFSSSVQEVEVSVAGVYAGADDDSTGTGEYASLDGLGASMVEAGT
jgi:hypothetical protein